MQHKMVDMVIVGADRVTAQGDVCNKIGTYLKALAAHDNEVPFYVALPSPTIDFAIVGGCRHSDRATRRGRSRDDDRQDARRPHRDRADRARRLSGREFCFRRHAGAACHRPDHRARRHRAQAAPRLRRLFPSAPKSGQIRTAGSADGLRIELPQIARRRPPVGNRAGDRARHRAAAACARTLRGERIAAAVRPPRRSRGARSGRRVLDRRDQILDRRFSRRPEMAGLSRALRSSVFSPRRSMCRARSSRPTPG